MQLNQIVILLVAQFVISALVTSGYEIISTTIEKDVNKDNRCQQEVIKVLRNKLQEQQNFCINFSNNSYELQNQKQLEESRKEAVHLFDKKLEEVVNKQNDLLQQFDQKIEAKFVNIQEEVLKLFKKEIENITSNLGKVEHGITSVPKSCLEILKKSDTVSDGIYTIQPNITSHSFEVWCDMHTRGGGWTYLLNRFDGSQNFYLDWKNYKNGFGSLNGEFWLGLQHMYKLTGFQDNQLLIQIVDWDNKHYYAMYNAFRIGSEEEGYPIKVLDGFSGDAGDSLTYHKNMKFSTHDKDQDLWDMNCALACSGAWWYNNCHVSHLTGTYNNKATVNDQAMFWLTIKNDHHSLKQVKMIVRPNHIS